MANNKTEIENKTETEIETEIDDISNNIINYCDIDINDENLEKEKYKINYDNYECVECNKVFKTKKGFRTHIEKKHNINDIYIIPDLQSNIDKDKHKIEELTNKNNPSSFRIRQYDFIKNGITKENKNKLFKNNIFSKIKSIGRETLYGISNEMKMKIIEYIIKIDLESRHSLLENVIKIFTIINQYSLNQNCMPLFESDSPDFFVKSYDDITIMNIDNIIKKKINSMKLLLNNFMDIEKYIIIPKLKKNTSFDIIKNYLIGNISPMCISMSYNEDPYSYLLTKALKSFYVFYKYYDLQVFYSENIPLFYNYKLLRKKIDYCNPELYDLS